MKFVRVTFRCFGPFEEQSLDLSGPCGFHVVFGPNEAGKSSALRGLHALLFGFPVQSADDFRFKYNQFRIHASLVDSAGTTLECIRRKGKKATLLTADEKTEIPEASLTRFLGGLQQLQFEQLFGLDSKRLVEGGRDITDGRGDLGEALFAAGAGLAGLRALAQTLEERRLALYRFRGQTQLINKALSDHEKQVVAVRENILPPDKYAAAAIAAQGARKGGGTALRTDRGPLPTGIAATLPERLANDRAVPARGFAWSRSLTRRCWPPISTPSCTMRAKNERLPVTS